MTIVFLVLRTVQVGAEETFEHQTR